MINNADKILLQGVYRNSDMGIKAINSILSKVEDDDFNYDLNKQQIKYAQIKTKAAKKLNEMGENVEHSNIEFTEKKSSNWELNYDNHIANLMIKGSSMGITDMTNILNQNKSSDSNLVNMVNELIDFEEKNIELMKSYYNYND